ncbi:MAG: MotA/TolQ/ExbB proton channel family protein [Candidatus Omnitrophica bacterium]|nr:MotA/TolQ/ExbB proton channel family protein [Candidatus Omnitrophota bacterium]MBI3083748.1 MotA/TolQ/ExbB proton channel family protein [Candidatus Omnitrophota bacterium]
MEGVSAVMWQWFLKGGPVMWPLLLCSVIAAAVMLERLVFWIQEQRSQHAELIHKLLHLTERGLIDEALAAAKGTQDAIVRILVNGLSHHHFSLEGALEVAVHAELKRMKRYLGVLDTIITVAPLLGIFGTVTGILVAFGALEGRIPDPKIVASGIAQAVITTVAGLAIAIPTVVAYNYFCARVEDAASRMSTHITNFQILYQKGKANHVGETSLV